MFMFRFFRKASSEVNGVRCVACREGLPANNWDFEQLGEDGWVIVFYKKLHGTVRVTTVRSIGATVSISGGASVGYKRTEEMSENKVIQYIRNKRVAAGYTCLRCVDTYCQAKRFEWDIMEREINTVMINHSIIPQPRFTPNLSQVCSPGSAELNV